MGKRARQGGITNAALRAAQKVIEEQDPQARDIANAVYQQVRYWRLESGPVVFAPVTVAAEIAAPAIAESAGIPASAENLQEIASLLVARFMNDVVSITAEDLEAWRHEKEERRREALGRE